MSTENPDPFRAELDALRQHGYEHPVLAALQATLPAYREGARLPPGLYFERAQVPGLRIGTEHRVSVARIISVTASGESLVAQCQVLSKGAGPARTVHVRWYVHDTPHFWTQTFEEPESWWLQVLERHLARGGEPPRLPMPVSA